MFNRRTLLAGLALVGLSAASSAHAQTSLYDDSVHQERVSFADLDLASTSGAKTLMIRLRRAANDVCGRWDGSVDPMAHVIVDACARAAVARAVSQVHRPMLTAMLNGERDVQIATAAGR